MKVVIQSLKQYFVAFKLNIIFCLKEIAKFIKKIIIWIEY